MSAITKNPSPAQLAAVEASLREHLERANQYFGIQLPLPTVQYNLRGGNAGMALYQEWLIRLNPEILRLQPSAFIAQVPGHELAHLITHRKFAKAFGKKLQPHGREWRFVMTEVLGLSAERTHQFSYTKARQERTVAYQCQCPAPNHQHALGIRRHNKVIRHGAQYLCRRCKSVLTPIQPNVK